MSDANALAQKRVADVRDRISRLDDAGLDLIFREARTHTLWTDKPVGDDLLHELYATMAFGPTASNTCPVRLVFVQSAEAKERLKPCLMPGNVPKVEAAPVTAIIATDSKFYESMEKLFAHNPEGAKTQAAAFAADAERAQVAGFRNGTLQGAYFIITARALGLDCGPMSGFNNAAVDAEFFADGRCTSNFLCNIGYGDLAGIFPRNPRLGFDEACEIL